MNTYILERLPVSEILWHKLVFSSTPSHPHILPTLLHSFHRISDHSQSLLNKDERSEPVPSNHKSMACIYKTASHALCSSSGGIYLINSASYRLIPIRHIERFPTHCHPTPLGDHLLPVCIPPHRNQSGNWKSDLRTQAKASHFPPNIACIPN